MKAITVLIRNAPDELEPVVLLSEIEDVYYDAFEDSHTGCIDYLDLELIEERPE